MPTQMRHIKVTRVRYGWRRLTSWLLHRDPQKRGLAHVLLGCRIHGWDVLAPVRPSGIPTPGLVMGDPSFLSEFSELLKEAS